MLIYLLLWHYRLTQDTAYLRANYLKAVALLEVYRRDYERDFLLRDLDKWCVVEWPPEFRDGYDVEIQEGKVCRQPHISINAYYIEAVRTVNKMAVLLGEPRYRDEEPLLCAFYRAFYESEKHLFQDGVDTDHISLVGNVFPFAFGLCPDKACAETVVEMICKRDITVLCVSCTGRAGSLRKKRTCEANAAR